MSSHDSPKAAIVNAVTNRPLVPLIGVIGFGLASADVAKDHHWHTFISVLPFFLVSVALLVRQYLYRNYRGVPVPTGFYENATVKAKVVMLGSVLIIITLITAQYKVMIGVAILISLLVIKAALDERRGVPQRGTRTR